MALRCLTREGNSDGGVLHFTEVMHLELFWSPPGDYCQPGVTAQDCCLPKFHLCPSRRQLSKSWTCRVKQARAWASTFGDDLIHITMFHFKTALQVTQRCPFFLIQLAVLFQTLFSHFKDSVCTPWCNLLLNEAWRSVPWIVIANECNILVNSR